MKLHVHTAFLSAAAVVAFSVQGLQAQELDETTSVEIFDGGFVDYGDGDGFSIVIRDDGSQISELEESGSGGEIEDGEDGDEPIFVVFPPDAEFPEAGESVELVDPPIDQGADDCAACRDFSGAEPGQVAVAPEVVAALVILMADGNDGQAASEVVDCSTKANARRSVCFAAFAD
ncbi:hypothetical protein ACSBLW_07355 [Thioclava sp. FR2]|uniref:hypothetical protein n=1 Tax=Thioclava sp. FR2 TaxID=3445780 RepID=UPI003EC00F40